MTKTIYDEELDQVIEIYDDLDDDYWEDDDDEGSEEE